MPGEDCVRNREVPSLLQPNELQNKVREMVGYGQEQWDGLLLTLTASQCAKLVKRFPSNRREADVQFAALAGPPYSGGMVFQASSKPIFSTKIG